MTDGRISRILVVDTETTGTDPAADSVLEMGWVGIELTPDEGGLRDEWRIVDDGSSGWMFLEFEGEIPAEARAIHHIAPSDVRPGNWKTLPREDALVKLEQAGAGHLSAHNAKFDSSMLPELSDRPWLCTYRLARHLYPQAPSHKNQVLRYWLGVEPPSRMLEDLLPHRAFYDAAVTAALLCHMLNERALSFEEASEISARPIVMDVMPLGKHKGEKFADVPASYLNWMVRSGNWKDDIDMMASIRAVR